MLLANPHALRMFKTDVVASLGTIFIAHINSERQENCLLETFIVIKQSNVKFSSKMFKEITYGQVDKIF